MPRKSVLRLLGVLDVTRWAHTLVHSKSLGFIGRGGMGEVYRARDLKLKREVAIKILPDEFSCDPVGGEFQIRLISELFSRVRSFCFRSGKKEYERGQHSKTDVAIL